jgi:mannose-6-phosphate isomerase-like protein (cupin superfamily)
MRLILTIFLILSITTINAQSMSASSGGIQNVDTIGSNSKAENLYNKSIFGDSLASSFCIVIKKEVKAHRHAYHSEHVVVMDGEGMMKMGEKIFSIKKGDVIFIPKNTVHSVKTLSKTPLKVISIQAPLFDGKDRIMLEEK